MYTIGNIRDPALAQTAIEQLQKKGISVHTEIAADGSTILRVAQKAHVLPGLDVYFALAGVPRPRQAPAELEKMWALPKGRVTSLLLGISLFLFVLTHAHLLIEAAKPLREAVLNLFLISARADFFFFEVRSGQVWRLITPIFLHFGILHIIFNMLWLKELGKVYEYEKGALGLLIFVVLSGVLSNVLQYMAYGPFFGGMSGVVYALLGHLWMRRQLDSSFEFGLPKFDLYLMIGWFFLCLTGWVGPIANTAHGVGLCVGMLIGIWTVKGSVSSTAQINFSILALSLPIFVLAVEYLKLSGVFYFQLF